MFGQTETIIAMAIESLATQATKVPHAGQRQRNQAIQKLVHPRATQGDFAADGDTFAESKTRHGLGGTSDRRSLPRDFRQGVSGLIQVLFLGNRTADAQLSGWGHNRRRNIRSHFDLCRRHASAGAANGLPQP